MRLNEYFLNKYNDVFSNDLPSRLPNPDVSRHCIILEDENLSIND